MCFLRRSGLSLLFVVVLSFLLEVAPVASYASDNVEKQETVADVSVADLLCLRPDDRYLGDTNAPVVMVEYASFTCSHCADFIVKVFPQIKKQYVDTGRVLYIYRDFPLDKLSLTAAMLGSCYKDNKSFFAYVKAVFASYETLIATYKDLGLLSSIAKISNISDEEFKRCTTDSALMDDVVQRKFLAVSKLEVNSTPAFFINGRKYSYGHDFGSIAAEIERAEELAKAKA